MIWRWLHRHPVAVDLALVAVLLFTSVATALHTHHDQAAALSLGIAGTLPLLVRRRYPIAVTLFVAAVALAMIGLEIWVLPLQLGVALYTLGSTRTAKRDVAIGVAIIAAVAVAVLAAGGIEFGAAAARVVFLAAALLLGQSIGSRRAYIREIEDKAARLEREQETDRRRAAAEEQARIARELHDVIAHALSVIVVQATAAADAFERDPDEAQAPIEAVERTARSALADLRRVLGVLHGEADYEPQPGLARIDELVESIRTTGLHVSLEIEGTPRRLPAALDLSAYRIIQEALTNSLRHADASAVDVQISYGETLHLEVHDDGHGATNGGGGGNGLIGMRERATLLGGALTAGPAANGGYSVSATFPLESDE
jgi:signal transduction histidine kinase